MHYWNQLGFSSSLLKNNQFTVVKRPKDDDGDLATSCFSNEIFVYIEPTNFVERGLHNIGFIKSALYHEKFHLVERLACPNDGSFKSVNEHVDVYYRQFTKSDFKTTMTAALRRSLYIYMRDKILERMNPHYKTKLNEWEKKFDTLKLY